MRGRKSHPSNDFHAINQMNDGFWKDLTRRLTLVRKRKAALDLLLLGLGILGIFALLVSRSTYRSGYWSGGSLSWPSLIIAGICVASMVAVCACMEQDS